MKKRHKLTTAVLITPFAAILFFMMLRTSAEMILQVSQESKDLNVLCGIATFIVTYAIWSLMTND